MTQETKRVTLKWTGNLRFEGTSGESRPSIIDASDTAGPGPMPTLLLAAAACSSADIVEMMDKMRVKLKSLVVEGKGTRREEEPRRYVAVQLTYRLSGDGLDKAKAQRAVSLAIEKYCSVIASLSPDIKLAYDVVIN